MVAMKTKTKWKIVNKFAKTEEKEEGIQSENDLANKLFVAPLPIYIQEEKQIEHINSKLQQCKCNMKLYQFNYCFDFLFRFRESINHK